MNQSTFIPGWYAIFQSNQLPRAKPVGVTRFNMPLVLWRIADGLVHCMLDHCPHRGAKLSIGKIKNNCIECPYHGFQFNAQGRCQLAPEFGKSLPGLTVKKFSVTESMGMIWFFYGEVPTEFAFPRLEQLHDNFVGAYSEGARTWDSHITYCIENQLDFTHLPEVHHNTIGRGFKYPEAPQFELNQQSIAICFDDGRQVFQYYFPNIWVLNVSKKMKLVVYFAPIDAISTELYLKTYNPLLKIRPLKKLLSFMFNKLNLIILKQDQRVVSSQGLSPSYEAKDDRLMKNDQAIKFFRELWQSGIE